MAKKPKPRSELVKAIAFDLLMAAKHVARSRAAQALRIARRIAA